MVPVTVKETWKYFQTRKIYVVNSEVLQTIEFLCHTEWIVLKRIFIRFLVQCSWWFPNEGCSHISIWSLLHGFHDFLLSTGPQRTRPGRAERAVGNLRWAERWWHHRIPTQIPRHYSPFRISFSAELFLKVINIECCSWENRQLASVL